MKRNSFLFGFIFFLVSALMLVTGCSNFEQKSGVTDISVPVRFSVNSDNTNSEDVYRAEVSLIFIEEVKMDENQDDSQTGDNETDVEEEVSDAEEEMEEFKKSVLLKKDSEGNCSGNISFTGVPVGHEIIVEITITLNGEEYAKGSSKPQIVSPGSQTVRVHMTKTNPDEPDNPENPEDPDEPDEPEEIKTTIVGKNGNMNLAVYDSKEGLKAKVIRNKNQSNGYYETTISYVDENKRTVNYVLSGASYSNPDLEDDVYFPYVNPGKKYTVSVEFKPDNGNGDSLSESFEVTIPEESDAPGEAYVIPVSEVEIDDIFSFENNALRTVSDNLDVSVPGDFLLKATFWKDVNDYSSWLGDIIVSPKNWDKSRSLYAYDSSYKEELLAGGSFGVTFSVILNYSDGKKNYSILSGSFFDSMKDVRIAPINDVVTSLASNNLAVPQKPLYAFDRADRGAETYFNLTEGKASGHGVQYKYDEETESFVLTELFVDPENAEGLEVLEVTDLLKGYIADYMNLGSIENIYTRDTLTSLPEKFKNTEDCLGVYNLDGENRYIYRRWGWSFTDDGKANIESSNSIAIFLLEDFDSLLGDVTFVSYR